MSLHHPGREQCHNSLYVEPGLAQGAGSAALQGSRTPETAPAPGYLSPEFVAHHESAGTWVEITEGEDAFVACSDDRPATAESAAALLHAAPEGMRDPREVTTSVFGGLSGAAKAALVAGVAQYGPSFIARVGGLQGMMHLLVRQGDGSFTAHTAEGAEGNPEHFNPEAEAPIGCAYNMLLGTTAVLLGREYASTGESLIQTVARRDQIAVFGSDTDVDLLMLANHTVATHLSAMTQTGDATAFSIGRDTYVDLQQPIADRPDRPAVPIAVLAGQHLPAAETGVISNFSLTQGGRPGEIYRLDIARATEEIMKALPGYNLSPALLMRTLQLDSAPVRAALFAQDTSHNGQGPLDPNGLPMGWRGDPWAAINELHLKYDR